jgi:hypothetical protein
MSTPHTLADAVIVLALVGAFVVWVLLRHKDRRRRLDMVHQERLAAMEKGIPIPEWPSDPPKAPADPRLMLVHGVTWIAFGLGGMIALRMTALQVNGTLLWPLPLPLLLLGVGLVLIYGLVRTR